MHYYPFNIGDYASHTGHLDPLEDIAYRRMLDWCYLHESSLPEDTEEIARLIRMRTHSECIANVLLEFFYLTDDGYRHERVDVELGKYHDKKGKAKASANARWLKDKNKKNNANAMRTHSERNAKQETINKKHEPIKKKGTKFVPPSPEEVEQYILEKNYQVNAEAFIAHYESNGWKVGRNKMKSWKAAITTWQTRGKGNGSHQQAPKLSLAERATEHRKQFEATQQGDSKLVGEDDTPLRS
jgi:uncharacterized protein YdaU (DUF1376 family)